MIVGSLNIDILKLTRSCKSAEEFCKYSDSLVPEDFRQIQSIIHNQRYICCLYLRKESNLDWKIKRPLIDEVMQGIQVTGYINSVIEIETIMLFVDKHKLEAYKKMEV